MKVLYNMCDGEDRWIANFEHMYQIRCNLEEDDDEDDGGGGGGVVGGSGETVLNERELMLLQMERNEHCVEIFYRLVAHTGTRESTLRLLLDAQPQFTSGGIGRGGVGKLLHMTEMLPVVFAAQQGAIVKQLRQAITESWSGVAEEHAVYWQDGHRDLSADEAAQKWDKQREEEMEQQGRDLSEIIERCMELRFDIDDLENKLADAQECMLNFFHQCGWYLRTVAILLHSTREQLSGTKSHSSGDGCHINVSLDHAQILFGTLFGSPESAGGGGGGRGHRVGGGGGGGGWSRGTFQSLLALAMDVSHVEMFDSEVIHSCLTEQDLEDCKMRVDRWSEGWLLMVDEKKLQQRLYTRLSMLYPADQAELAFVTAQGCVRRRVLGAYDGFNSVRRCRSAREHLLCGLQDVLEHVLTPLGREKKPLLAHVLRLEQVHLFMFICMDGWIDR